MRVLFADDDADFLEKTSGLMEDWGYEVFSCLTAQEASSFIDAHVEPIALGLFDMEFKHENKPEGGLELVKAMSFARPFSPAIVLTGVGNTDNAARCMESRAFTYLPKGDNAGLYHLALRRGCCERLRRLREGFETKIGASFVKWLSVAVALPDLDKENNLADELRFVVARILHAASHPRQAVPSADSPAKLISVLLGPQFTNIEKVLSESEELISLKSLDCFADKPAGTFRLTGDTTPSIDFLQVEVLAYHVKLSAERLEHLNALLSGMAGADNWQDMLVLLWAAELTGAGATAWAESVNDSTKVTIEFMQAYSKGDEKEE